MKKLGSNAYPFFFELPPHCPASVTLQPAPGDMGKPCGVDYELKCFVGESHEDKPHKRYVAWKKASASLIRTNAPLPCLCFSVTYRSVLLIYSISNYVAGSVELCGRNSVRLAIRKIMYAPSKQGEQPSVEVSKEFMMSPNKLHLEASLDKELYYHGETVAVNVHIQNNSNKSVKKIKVCGKGFLLLIRLVSHLHLSSFRVQLVWAFDPAWMFVWLP